MVVMDSDFADPRKRVSLRERAVATDVRLVFVRVICDFDVMAAHSSPFTIGRDIMADSGP